MESSGGIALLRDDPGSGNDDFLVSGNVCVMMVDTKDQSTLPVTSQQWILHVTETLRRLVWVHVSSQGSFIMFYNFFLTARGLQEIWSKCILLSFFI